MFSLREQNYIQNATRLLRRKYVNGGLYIFPKRLCGKSVGLRAAKLQFVKFLGCSHRLGIEPWLPACSARLAKRQNFFQISKSDGL